MDIPATVNINGHSYQIIISGDVYSGNTTLESIKFENGVKAGASLASLFSGCTKLERVDLNGLDTSLTTDMASMFFLATSLQQLDLSGFDVTSLSEMKQMFFYCISLKSINLSSFKGAISKSASSEETLGPLEGCSNLETIILGKDWTPADNKDYLSLGLTGNWQNTATKEVVTSETLQNEFVESMAGTYTKTSLPPSTGTSPQYIVDGYQKEGNMWEVHTPNDTFHGYCLNHDRATPSGYFDKVEIDVNATESTKKIDSNGRSNYIMDYLDSKNYGYKELAPNMAKALVALIYWSEYGGNGGTYKQSDIWHFTNDYSSTMSSDLKAKIAGHTYDDIGKEYKLYIYVPSENNKANKKNAMQNLLSIEGATNKTYAGVQVQKVDNTSNAVGGAIFRVYKADDKGNKSGETFANGKDYLEFTTSSNGIGGLYRMDNSQGLPVGSYILEEYEAPSGYERNTTQYTFKVTDNDDQKVISVGNGNGVIVDNVITNYHGGGFTLKKVDSSTGTGLTNAEFTLYEVDSSNGSKKETKVKIYKTDSNGILTSGGQDLEIGKNYILRETKAPDGYNLNQSNTGKPFEKEITLDSKYENKFYDIGNVSDSPKTGQVQIEAKKVLKNGGTLKAGEYTFQLLDASGKVLQTKSNDADGKITFDKITLSASDMPAVDYQIKEVKGTDANIEYDEHVENVRVYITVNADGNIVCTPDYASNIPKFTNTAKVNFTGKLTVKKTVDGILADSNDKFNFNLYLTADSTDLNARTFNYTLDGKSGNFTFNKVETTSDGQTKYVSQEPFKLKKDSQLEITNLPVGAKYEVKEDDYTSEGYTLTSKSGDTGTISSDGTTANFKNTKNVIVPTSADTFTRSPFWITIALGSLVVIYIKKRKKKLNNK